MPRREGDGETAKEEKEGGGIAMEKSGTVFCLERGDS